MHKIRFVLLLVLLIAMTGCSSVEPLDAAETISTTESTETSVTDLPITPPERTPEETHLPDSGSKTPTLPEESNSSQNDSKAESTSTEVQSNAAQKPEQPQKPVSSETADSSPAPTETPKQESSPSTEEDSPVTEKPPAEVPTIQYATAADTREIAAKMVEYINSYRTAQGSSAAIRLSGLTKYAEYRSRQIITNFAHDTMDERAAATALQYGEYVDPSVYGLDGEPYYRANAREALAKAGYVGTIDYVAERLASQIRDSASHWEYIGSSEYGYIAVGVTYENGTWYCTVAVSSVNTDEY